VLADTTGGRRSPTTPRAAFAATAGPRLVASPVRALQHAEYAVSPTACVLAHRRARDLLDFHEQPAVPLEEWRAAEDIRPPIHLPVRCRSARCRPERTPRSPLEMTPDACASNSGEGGEDPATGRRPAEGMGRSLRQRIKQSASAALA